MLCLESRTTSLIRGPPVGSSVLAASHSASINLHSNPGREGGFMEGGTEVKGYSGQSEEQTDSGLDSDHETPVVRWDLS